MQIGELNVPKRKRRKRVGRGPGSGNGKTSGRGHKGLGQRSGAKHHPWFEGGQMPLQRRVPKRGFKSLNKSVYQLVNVVALERFSDGQTVDAALLKQNGLIKNENYPVKILGDGELTKKLTVRADAFSQTAQDKIAKAGGEAACVTRSA